MTLARTALRLCVSACLKGATIAEGRIYDSRISELAPESFVGDAKPTVILLTDNDEGDALSAQNGGPPFKRMIDLVLEIGMTSAEQVEQDGEIGYSVGYPVTDAEFEASLDLLQFQLVRRLAYDEGPLPELFQTFVRIRKQESHRQVLDESGVKIACRILTLTCEINDDRVAIVNSASPPSSDPFTVLPDPLRSVAQLLPEESAGRDVCLTIAAAMQPLAAPPLKGVDITLTNPNNAPPVEASIELPQGD